jgi:hypothetical protein
MDGSALKEAVILILVHGISQKKFHPKDGKKERKSSAFGRY